MNEIELLRNQLATERRHVREVASACATAHAGAPEPGDAALAALRGACGEYLGCVLDWFDRRDACLGELYARGPRDAEGRAALAALDLPGRGREALGKLDARAPARESWQELARFILGPWDARRRAIYALIASHPR